LVEETPFDVWLNSYCGAQEAKVSDALTGLFARNARLFPGPFVSPIEGCEAIRTYFVRYWERHDRSGFTMGKIADEWAHWRESGSIPALQEPYRVDAIFRAELDENGRCERLTFWQETLSVRETDMLTQRDA